MRAWVEYVRKMGSSEYLWDKDLQLGDWLGLDAREGSYYGATDGALCATAFYAYSAELLAKTANVLGKMHDFKEYTELSGNIKAAFRKRFMPDGVQILSNTQTAHVLVLKFHLAEPEKEGQIAANLVKMLHQNNDHLLTGFLGPPYLCQVLSEPVSYTHLDVYKRQGRAWERCDDIIRQYYKAGARLQPDGTAFRENSVRRLGSGSSAYAETFLRRCPEYARRRKPYHSCDSAGRNRK